MKGGAGDWIVLSIFVGGILVFGWLFYSSYEDMIERDMCTVDCLSSGLEYYQYVGKRCFCKQPFIDETEQPIADKYIVEVV